MDFSKILYVMLFAIFAFQSFVLTAQHSDSMQERYTSFLKLVENGKTAPNFTYVDIHGDSISLHDLKGNIIVLDFWATWCKPCVAQMPEFENLKERFAGDDIQFISISADFDIEKWHNFLKEKDWKDIQLYAGDLKGKPQLYYTLNYMPDMPNVTLNIKEKDTKPLVTSIPRYVVIDKDLKIHNNKAPKPGSAEMDAILKGLLN